ncbi:MAG: cysteine--tRNA ligase [Calditrichaeota bacterium]|nr:MAG: cysteine--tRNA ligase [Calditrichota bacterium]
MALVIYNSLSRKKEEFVPLHPGRVNMYVCGPTVYDYPHIGHAKSYITFDIVVRYLRYLQYNVLYVQNITDVGHLLDSGEDRILRGAQREKIEPMVLVERYTRAYFEAMDALNVLRPDISPRASGHIPEQIQVIELLLQKGFAYERNGSVYFDIARWPAYGKLSGRDVNEQLAGARLEINEEKRHPADFALWKRAEAEHIMQWSSPWGRGYPGWHIECSAMSMKYLGESIDIHGGGMENQFPHHECEIAQSEAATGVPFVRYWMHHNMVLVNGVKMSKSLGNFTSVQKALHTYNGEQIRFFILSSHYRSPMDFNDEAIKAAAVGLERLHATWHLLRRMEESAPEEGNNAQAEELGERMKNQFEREMNDDFNTPAAIAQLFDHSREINKLLSGPVTRSAVVTVRQMFGQLAGDVLGILPREQQGFMTADPFIHLIVRLREQLRTLKNWQLADEIRCRMLELGVEIKDGKAGSEWQYKR